MAVTFDDLKVFLGITDSGNDGELLAMLDRAVATLEARVGPLSEVDVVDEVHTGPGPLVLKRWPVISVTSVSDNGSDVTDLDLDADAGVLYGGFFSCIRRGVKVTYVAGRADLPMDLEAAVLELAKHLWTTQRVPGSRRYGSGDPDERTLAGASSYLLPYRVQTLIEPYVAPRLA